jgi:hypothetical protein
MWTKYRVQWDFLGRLCGSVPADPEIVRAWLEARKPKVRAPASRSIDEIQEEVFATLAAEEEPAAFGIHVFQRVDGHLAQRAATIKAHLKDCAKVLSAQYIGNVRGERAFSTRVINGVYPDPKMYWIPVRRPDGSLVTKHDGEQDKPIHVRGPRGEQLNALKRYEWVEPARLDFCLLVLTSMGNKPSVSEEDLSTVMEYGGVHGYAGERGDGEGKYVFTIQREEA